MEDNQREKPRMKEINQIIDQINEEHRRLRQQDPLGLSPNATSLDFHQAVYRNPSLPIPTRQRSAIAALQFEHPKLAVTAVIDEASFAYRLDKAVERTQKVKNGQAIMNGTKLIEAKPEPFRRHI